MFLAFIKRVTHVTFCDTEGFVQAFRRVQSPMETARFKLRGLDASAQYAVRNFDVPGDLHFSGRELEANGLPVEIKAEPGAVPSRKFACENLECRLDLYLFIHPKATVSARKRAGKNTAASYTPSKGPRPRFG